MPTSSRSRRDREAARYAALAERNIAVLDAETTTEELADAAERGFPRVARAVLIPLAHIQPNPDNPRKSIDDGPLEDLAASIAERGLLQPLVVRRDPDQPGFYIVIAGTRRLLAARRIASDAAAAVRAHVEHLACLVTQANDRDAYADSLLENLARSDLSRREVMDALLRLEEEFGWSGSEIARRTGRNQSDVSKLLRIAKDQRLSSLVHREVIKPTVAGEIARLPDPVREETITAVEAGTIKTVADVRQRIAASQRPQATPPSESSSLPSSYITTPESPPASPAHSERPSGRYQGDVPGGGSYITTSLSEAPVSLQDEGVRDLDPAAASGHAFILQAVRERHQEIGSFLGIIDETPAGHAVLTAVRQDLDAAYDKLAAYIKHLNTRSD